MKGIILAGGAGSRLYPLTLSVSKQLLPVYDKPMVYYPLSTLMMAGIRNILLISTPEQTPLFKRLLGTGKQFGLELSYAIQERPEGIAQAFCIGRSFVGSDSCALVLGDNIFHGPRLAELLTASKNRKSGATIFAYQVNDPARYGVVSFDTNGQPISIEEKPKAPKSSWAVTGLYFYDNNVLQYASDLAPSPRGELEITDVNQAYLRRRALHVEQLGQGYAWLDMGTCESLLEAGEYVATLERRQGLKIGCPEEIALHKRYIRPEELEDWIRRMGPSQYSEYVRRAAKSVAGMT